MKNHRMSAMLVTAAALVLLGETRARTPDASVSPDASTEAPLKKAKRTRHPDRDRDLPPPAQCPVGMLPVPGYEHWGRTARLRDPPDWEYLERDTLPGFCMDELEVSVKEYRSCVAAGACRPPTRPSDYNRPGRDRHPIDGLMREQAAAYCAWRDKRLPTPEDYDIAGSDIWLLEVDVAKAQQFEKVGVCCGRTERQGTCEVGSSPGDVSKYGIRDLAANAPEWTTTGRIGFPPTVACGVMVLPRETKLRRSTGFRCVWPSTNDEKMHEVMVDGRKPGPIAAPRDGGVRP